MDRGQPLPAQSAGRSRLRGLRAGRQLRAESFEVRQRGPRCCDESRQERRADTLKRLLSIVLGTLLVGGAGCVSGAQVRASSEVIKVDLERARRSGAMRCA